MFTPTGFSALLAGLALLLAGLVLVKVAAVNLHMVRPRQCNQVLRAIVILCSVDVVNILAFTKRSAVGRFPYNAMLGDVAFRICSRVIWHMKKNMPAMFNPATLPKMMTRAALTYWVMSVGEVGAIVLNVTRLTVFSQFRNNRPASTIANRIRRDSLSASRTWGLVVVNCISWGSLFMVRAWRDFESATAGTNRQGINLLAVC